MCKELGAAQETTALRPLWTTTLHVYSNIEAGLATINRNQLAFIQYWYAYKVHPSKQLNYCVCLHNLMLRACPISFRVLTSRYKPDLQRAQTLTTSCIRRSS